MQGVGRNFLPPPVNWSVLVDRALLLRAAVGTGAVSSMGGVLAAALLSLSPFSSAVSEVLQVLSLGFLVMLGLVDAVSDRDLDESLKNSANWPVDCTLHFY